MANKLDLTKLKAISAAIKSIGKPANMKKYGEAAAGMIKLRTRLGSGVDKQGDDKGKLKPLAESTVESRKELQKLGQLSAFTTPRRSNLTESGQLLDSVQVTSVEQGRVTVGPKGDRSGKGSATNEQVGEYVTRAGRPFNNLSRVELKRINNQIKADLRAAIKSSLTKK